MAGAAQYTGDAGARRQGPGSSHQDCVSSRQESLVRKQSLGFIVYGKLDPWARGDGMEVHRHWRQLLPGPQDGTL